MSAKNVNTRGGVPLVVENREGVFSRYPKKTTGSWSESDRGGTRLCEKVYNLVVKGKFFWTGSVERSVAGESSGGHFDFSRSRVERGVGGRAV